jgi:hypothetical protein
MINQWTQFWKIQRKNKINGQNVNKNIATTKLKLQNFEKFNAIIKSTNIILKNSTLRWNQLTWLFKNKSLLLLTKKYHSFKMFSSLKCPPLQTSYSRADITQAGRRYIHSWTNIICTGRKTSNIWVDIIRVGEIIPLSRHHTSMQTTYSWADIIQEKKT